MSEHITGVVCSKCGVEFDYVKIGKKPRTRCNVCAKKCVAWDKQCIDLDCREWFVTTIKKKQFCPKCDARHVHENRERYNFAYRAVTGTGHAERVEFLADHRLLYPRKRCVKIFDIQHAPTEKSLQMIERILAGTMVLGGGIV